MFLLDEVGPDDRNSLFVLEAAKEITIGIQNCEEETLTVTFRTPQILSLIEELSKHVNNLPVKLETTFVGFTCHINYVETSRTFIYSTLSALGIFEIEEEISYPDIWSADIRLIVTGTQNQICGVNKFIEAFNNFKE